jgi:iduronate 2-sulfatase
MDAQLGRVIAALDETGLAANTIIVLWGDHGWHLGDHGMWCKHTNYEQATRIPLIVAAPGLSAAGANSAALIETVDLFPTLCELADIPLPNGIDGRSFAAVVRDPAREHRDHVTHVYPRGERLGRAIRTARHRLVEWKKTGSPDAAAEVELYDYEIDPEETGNLAARLPDVVGRLRLLLAQQNDAKPQWRPAPVPADSKAAAPARGGL